MARLAPGPPLATLSEQEWDGILFRSAKSLAKSLGWTSYHTLRSKGSRAGYPDRTLFKDRIVFAELKSETGKPTGEQKGWLDGLARAGGEVYLWRPSDVDEVGEILGRRWTFLRAVPGALPQLVGASGAWTPRSIWIPGVGRDDEGGTEI